VIISIFSDKVKESLTTNMFRQLILLIIIFTSIDHYGQTGSIRGIIFNKNNGEPVMFTNVIIDGTTQGSATDINGYFIIKNVNTGYHTIVSTYLGFDTVKQMVQVKANEVTSINLTLTPQSRTLRAVEVNANRAKAQNNIQISSYEVSSEKIKQLPSMGAEADLVQYLQVIPGIIYTGEQGGQLYIRGGSPIQNKVLLDGMVVYNPFHSIGMFSVFETDIIRHAEVYTGGFNSEFGNRLSAIVDVTTKDGNKKNLSGKVGINPFLGKIILEGPIQKLDNDGASSSFILSAKQSHINHTDDLLYRYIGEQGLPYEFTDLYGKFSMSAKNGSRFSLFGFNFNDKVTIGGESIDWSSFGLGNKFIIVPNNSTSLINGSLSFSDYKTQLYVGTDTSRYSQIYNFQMGLGYTYFLKNSEINYGFAIRALAVDYSFKNNFDINYNLTNNTTDINGYVKFKHRIDKWVIEPGIRLEYYAGLREMSLEPRFGAKYNWTDGFRLKLAGGKYSQNLISAISEHDIVNLFSGFLFSPDEQLKDLNGNYTTDKIQKAWHLISGVEIDLGRHSSLQIEPYVKYFDQLINVNRYKMFGQDPNYLIESGISYGNDISFKYDFNRTSLWASYSISKTTRKDIVEEYPTHFDRRHNVNLMGTYKMGEDNNWELSARWNLGSGFPFTKTQGFYEQLNLNNIDDYISANGEMGVIYGDRNAGRLPYYHRLDISLKRYVYFGENGKLEIIAAVTNTYNRPNVFYFDRVSYERVNQLPIIPAIGMNLSF
jgi:hypothetical protein